MCYAIVFAAAAAAMSAVSAINQGDTARKSANMNADFQKQTAVSVENQAAQVSADKKLAARRLQSSQVAAAGAGGIDPATGTPLKLEGETSTFSELDSLRIINNASRTAWGLNTQADIGAWAGGRAQSAGYMNAGTTLLGATSNAFYGYARLNQAPDFTVPATGAPG